MLDQERLVSSVWGFDLLAVRYLRDQGLITLTGYNAELKARKHLCHPDRQGAGSSQEVAGLQGALEGRTPRSPGRIVDEWQAQTHRYRQGKMMVDLTVAMWLEDLGYILFPQELYEDFPSGFLNKVLPKRWRLCT